MATKRWRKGSVEKIHINEHGYANEYRVGPVPDASGIVGQQKHVQRSTYGPGQMVTTRDIYFDPSKYVFPDWQDLLNAINKIKTPRVVVSVYVKRASKQGFMWIGDKPKNTAEIKSHILRIMRGQLPFNDTIDYARSLLTPKYDGFPYLTAWNFMESH